MTLLQDSKDNLQQSSKRMNTTGYYTPNATDRNNNKNMQCIQQSSPTTGKRQRSSETRLRTTRIYKGQDVRKVSLQFCAGDSVSFRRMESG